MSAGQKTASEVSMDLAALGDIVERFAGKKVILFGDFVADEFQFGEISRVSREAPVLILRHRGTNVSPGGGANAANNLAALGAKVYPITVVGEDAAGNKLFEKPVNPQRNSCAPHAQRGTFEEFVPVSPQLNKIRLVIGESTAAEFRRGAQAAPAAISFGAQLPDAPHRLSLSPTGVAAAISGISYTVQAKPADAPHWQTLAVGLPTPHAEIDVNQFPGSKSVEVRVMKSDGFTEDEVFRDTKNF